MATAAVLVHRFYMRRSLRDFSEKVHDAYTGDPKMLTAI